VPSGEGFQKPTAPWQQRGRGVEGALGSRPVLSALIGGSDLGKNYVSTELRTECTFQKRTLKAWEYLGDQAH
jgi:hypothetical protein